MTEIIPELQFEEKEQSLKYQESLSNSEVIDNNSNATLNMNHVIIQSKGRVYRTRPSNLFLQTNDDNNQMMARNTTTMNTQPQTYQTTKLNGQQTTHTIGTGFVTVQDTFTYHDEIAPDEGGPICMQKDFAVIGSTVEQQKQAMLENKQMMKKARKIKHNQHEERRKNEKLIKPQHSRAKSNPEKQAKSYKQFGCFGT